MTNSLILYCCIFMFAVMTLIFYLIKKDKINIKYSLIWIIILGILLIFLLIPGLLGYVTKLLGFNLSSNMIFSLLIGSLVVINISTTSIVSSQDKKIRLLIQEVSLLKDEKGKKNEK